MEGDGMKWKKPLKVFKSQGQGILRGSKDDDAKIGLQYSPPVAKFS